MKENGDNIEKAVPNFAGIHGQERPKVVSIEAGRQKIGQGEAKDSSSENIESKRDRVRERIYQSIESLRGRGNKVHESILEGLRGIDSLGYQEASQKRQECSRMLDEYKGFVTGLTADASSELLDGLDKQCVEDFSQMTAVVEEAERKIKVIMHPTETVGGEVATEQKKLDDRIASLPPILRKEYLEGMRLRGESADIKPLEDKIFILQERFKGLRSKIRPDAVRMVSETLANMELQIRQLQGFPEDERRRVKPRIEQSLREIEQAFDRF